MTREFEIEDRGFGNPLKGDPETITRFEGCEIYELSENAFFNDLFARRLGATGICGGYGRFLPGSSLPCHIHEYDESITIVKGKAACLVQGRRHEMTEGDTAFVPKRTPHRFLNHAKEEMAMVWVYAGDEPDRRIVDAGYCSGKLSWSKDDLLAAKRELVSRVTCKISRTSLTANLSPRVSSGRIDGEESATGGLICTVPIAVQYNINAALESAETAQPHGQRACHSPSQVLETLRLRSVRIPNRSHASSQRNRARLSAYLGRK